MDEDDSLPALAPQWLKAGKPSGATGGGSAREGATGRDFDSGRIPAAGGSARRTGATSSPRTKPQHLASPWRTEQQSSRGGGPGPQSPRDRKAGSSAAQGHRSTQAADRSVPGGSRAKPADDSRRLPAPQAPPRPQPASQHTREFDNTFPHLAYRSAGPRPAQRPLAKSAWQQPGALPLTQPAASDSKWTSRLAQPASAASPATSHPLSNGARDTSRRNGAHERQQAETLTPRSTRPLVPVPVGTARSLDKATLLRSAVPGTSIQRPAAGPRARPELVARLGSQVAAEAARDAGPEGATTAGSTLTVLTRRATAPQGSTPAPATEPAPAPTSNGTPVKAKASLSGKAQEQNDRNSFFQSLRSKQPPGTHPPLSSAQSSSVASGLSELELGALSRQPSVDVPEAAAQSPHANGQARPRDQQSAAVESLPEAAVAALCNGNGAHQDGQETASLAPYDAQLLAEEEAFLRSLGWHESDDDSQGGLTEEEIAAFHAKMQAVSFLAPAATTQGSVFHLT